MLAKTPQERISLQQIKVPKRTRIMADQKLSHVQEHSWVNGYGLYPLIDQQANCSVIEVTQSEVENCVTSIPKLDTLILVKVGYFKRQRSNRVLAIFLGHVSADLSQEGY